MHDVQVGLRWIMLTAPGVELDSPTISSHAFEGRIVAIPAISIRYLLS